MYIRQLEDVLEVFSTSFVLSVCLFCTTGISSGKWTPAPLNRFLNAKKKTVFVEKNFMDLSEKKQTNFLK